MTSKALYVLAIPEEAQVEESGGEERSITSLGVLGGGIGNTESLSSQPGEKLITGWYRGEHADEMAQEFEELFGAAGIDEVPYRGIDGDIKERGYYTLSDVTVSKADPRETRAQMFDGVMLKKGTRKSHWRCVSTNPININHDLGNDTQGLVAVPAAASKVRWFDSGSLTREGATPVETRFGEHGEVEMYDVDEPSFASPTLIYDLPYDEEGKMDVRLWDDHGNEEKTYTDSDGDTVVQWQCVFDLKHDFAGCPIISNDIVRYRFDEEQNEIIPGLSGGYGVDYGLTYGVSSVETGESDWELYDLDITEITMAEIRGQVEFRNPAASPTEYYTLDMALKRGYTGLQWSIPPNQSGATPNGLQDYLEPISVASVVDPQETKGLKARSEVRK